VYSEEPAWKRLISHTLTAHERMSVIATIFSDDTQVETVRQLSANDARTFIDRIDEVSPREVSFNGQVGRPEPKLPHFAN